MAQARIVQQVMNHKNAESVIFQSPNAQMQRDLLQVRDLVYDAKQRLQQRYRLPPRPLPIVMRSCYSKRVSCAHCGEYLYTEKSCKD